MALYLPQRWRQAPDGPVELDHGHPLTRGLMQAVVGSIGAFDLVSGRADAAPLGKAVHGSGIGLYQEGPHADYTTRAARLPWRRAVCEGRTQFVAGYWTATTASAGLIVASAGGVTSTTERVRLGSDNSLRMQIHGNAYGATTAVYNGTSSSGELLNRDMTLAQRWHKDKNSGYGEAWVNGKTVARTSGTPQTVVSDCASFSDLDDYWYLSGGAVYGTTGILYAFYQWSRDLADGELAALQENKWQMLRPRRPVIYSLGSAGAVHELAGDATASASAAGSLTTAIQLAGASVVAVTAAGSISTGISLAGAAASVTLAGGALTTQIRLQGDALAAAVAAAGLTTAIQLAAAAQAGAQASGDLTTGGGAAALAGNALASAIAAGDLTIQIRLAGAAVAQAVAQGVLSTGISLAGAAAVGAAAQGALSTEIRLAGAAIAGALASGDISGAAQLAGAAIGSTLAAGDLSTAIRLAGAALAGVQATGDLTAPGSPASLAADAQAIAIAAGGLTTSIRLAGAAASVVQATGSLDVGVTMQASAFVSAMATGVLLTQIRLDAAAVAGALAAATLSVGTAEHGARVVGWRGARRQTMRRPPARQIAARPRRYG